VIIAPTTYNTINKLALGINDTYPLNVAAETTGRRTPTAILPFVNTALAARQPFLVAVDALRAEGVHILFGPGEWLPHRPGTGSIRTAGAHPRRSSVSMSVRGTPPGGATRLGRTSGTAVWPRPAVHGAAGRSARPEG
jgi:hypothetical protein